MLFAFIFTPVIALAAGWLSSAKMELGASSLYDNNILRYSDKYISRFNNREDAGRFHNSTLDDLILVNSFRLGLTMRLIGSQTTHATVDYRRRTYTHNSIKDWSYVAIALRQDVSKKISAQIDYSYIPEFYVRHFRDENWTALYGFRDPIVYQPFSFKKDEVGGWLQYALFTTTRVRTTFSFARYFYNEHFTEYDCKNISVGIILYHTVTKNLKLTAEFEATSSRGDGTVDMNPSYNQNVYGIAVEYQLPKFLGRKNSIGVGGEFSRSCYTSTHFLELDPNHAGRDDRSYRVSASYNFELLKNLGLMLSFGWHDRKVKTAATQNAEYLSAEKDYRQYQVGLDVRYAFNIVP
ncbi:MAG: hypothetical protein KF749_10240 [Bacteroidetes bacterium]|nr:hypothetical protein [Bacteroidota bacterium]MCW5896658.1 hypothetical protein [Bacteroidota bacterium]